MKQYTIYSDIHIGHPFEIKQKFNFTKNTIFLGDNFDVKNALKKEVKRIAQLREETIRKCKKAGGIYISGNHSLESFNERRSIVIRNKILFVHGDIIQWPKYSHFYRSFFKPGSNKITWHLTKFIRSIYPGVAGKSTLIYPDPKPIHIERAKKLAKEYKCKTIVMGHFHPRETLVFRKEGIKIVFIQRGKTIIKL